MARLAFSFLILGIVAAWEGRKVDQAGGNAGLYYTASILLVMLGFASLRERHRRRDDN